MPETATICISRRRVVLIEISPDWRVSNLQLAINLSAAYPARRQSHERFAAIVTRDTQRQGFASLRQRLYDRGLKRTLEPRLGAEPTLGRLDCELPRLFWKYFQQREDLATTRSKDLDMTRTATLAVFLP